MTWTISHGKKSCNRRFDWSICLRPTIIFSVANNMKCHIKVILAISVVKVKNKVKNVKGKDFRSCMYRQGPWCPEMQKAKIYNHSNINTDILLYSLKDLMLTINSM